VDLFTNKFKKSAGSLNVEILSLETVNWQRSYSSETFGIVTCNFQSKSARFAWEFWEVRFTNAILISSLLASMHSTKVSTCFSGTFVDLMSCRILMNVDQKPRTIIYRFLWCTTTSSADYFLN
jgi:hypothetical protein